MKLYGLPAPFPFIKGHVRHVRPIWLMEELGIPYELHLLDTENGEDEGAAFRAINPFGKVPALEDGALRMSESGAICTYLAEKHAKLIPPSGSAERGKHDQWMFTAVAMIEPHSSRVLAADFFYKDDPEGPMMRSLAQESLDDVLPVIEAHLEKNRFLMGDGFTVSDIMMTCCLRLASHSDAYKSYPNVRAYIGRNTERPAFSKAAARQ